MSTLLYLLQQGTQNHCFCLCASPGMKTNKLTLFSAFQWKDLKHCGFFFIFQHGAKGRDASSFSLPFATLLRNYFGGRGQSDRIQLPADLLLVTLWYFFSSCLCCLYLITVWLNVRSGVSSVNIHWGIHSILIPNTESNIPFPLLLCQHEEGWKKNKSLTSQL